MKNSLIGTYLKEGVDWLDTAEQDEIEKIVKLKDVDCCQQCKFVEEDYGDWNCTNDVIIKMIKEKTGKNVDYFAIVRAGGICKFYKR